MAPPDERDDLAAEEVGAWAKRFHFAVRGAVEAILRAHDLGPTQWAVLQRLATDGPTLQSDLGRLLGVERATLSSIVAALVRKGLVTQEQGVVDQRQRTLALTAAGTEVWDALPDPVAAIRRIAFEGTDAADRAAALRVLQAATLHVDAYMADR
jgi:DNA-binding MarR family transcriptional regulator